MRAALQAAAGKSGKPGLYPQEFASFQRSFEERLEEREREHVGVVKQCRVSRGGLAARGTYLLRKALIYVCELISFLLNYKRTDNCLMRKIIYKFDILNANNICPDKC